MTLSEIATYRVFTLTEVVAVVGGMEEDLDVDDDLGGADAVLEEEGMESRYRAIYMLVPVPPSHITLRISKAC